MLTALELLLLAKQLEHLAMSLQDTISHANDVLASCSDVLHALAVCMGQVQEGPTYLFKPTCGMSGAHGCRNLLKLASKLLTSECDLMDLPGGMQITVACANTLPLHLALRCAP